MGFRAQNNLAQRDAFKSSWNRTKYEYDTTSGGSVFDSDLMTKAGSEDLDWDDNGQLTTGPSSIELSWNWDGKLRDANDVSADLQIALKYDPMGNRVYKSSTVDGTTTNRKYIVDISGNLPTLLCEIDTSDGSLKKSYVWIDDCRWTTDEVFKTVMPQAFHNFDFCSLIFDIAL